VIRLILAISLTLTGCATSIRTEVEHVSHPLAGWPVSDRYTEDGLSQANVIVHWQKADWYVDAGLGYNLKGRNGGGYYGPALTSTVRAGREWKLR
jgi:hypothetical protein